MQVGVLHHCGNYLLAHLAVNLLCLAATEQLYLYGLDAAHYGGVLAYHGNSVGDLGVVLDATVVCEQHYYKSYDGACRQ